MEIEFNIGRVSPTEPNQPVAKRSTSPVASAAVSFSASDSLKAQLDQISTVRPEQVAKAKELVADAHYPPDYVLNRIAVLLAIKTKAAENSSSG